ncbi:hypothetical protein OV203_17490 [Nannocystis sp. ILAH1]|uniref:hypothetical protein n=1 Tax=unclassified Nannocystis TaxID=2627009 RepID=UPI0022706DF7|nr:MULTISPECIES: hypothetical protein [unclassified Nannocystis]MCY0988934.1 hypothetical protein [Nannocystis sp. ILAH1]MCY1072640.1 hypothetical protein [Nannocystis sp. RBIL2]
MLDPHFAGALIGTITLLIAFIHGLRFARLAMLHRTLRRAFNAGVIADAELLARLFGSRTQAERDALDNRNGAMLIAMAAACVGFGWLQQEPAALRLAEGVALFPLFVGVVLAARGRGGSRRNSRDVLRDG